MIVALFLLAASPENYALIVTNNRSLDLQRPDLRYADDDGVQYAMLFGEIFGDSHVKLLTTFDKESERLYPDWPQRVQAPSRANFFAEVAKLAEVIATNHRQGNTSEVYLVFAGHGDVDHGQGFIELSDGRLTAQELDTLVISRLPADRIHLVLDSCNSYFMLNPRKPGGRHFASQPEATGLFARHKNLGAIISTSAEAVTYEWSEVQSGIFSYLVRSALRGGADTNESGQLSYRYVAAFISTATQSVVNDLYRPKVFARGPGGDLDARFVAWPKLPSETSRVIVPKGRERRLTVRDAHGVRVADVHTEADAQMQLVLPNGSETFDISETPLHAKEAPLVWTMRAKETLVLNDQGRVPAVAARGESPVFSALFAVPFGPTAAAKFSSNVEPPVYGVTRADAQRLRLYLQTAAEFAQQGRWVATGIFGAVGAGGLTIYAVEESAHRSFSESDASTLAVLLGLGVGGAAASLLTLFLPDPVEKLARNYAALDLSSEATRAKAVSENEDLFAAQAAHDRRNRLINGGFALFFGSAAIAIEIGVSATSRSVDLGLLGASVSLGTADLVLGVLELTVLRTATERMWQQYLTETSDKRDGGVAFVPFLAPVRNGATLGFAAVF